MNRMRSALGAIIGDIRVKRSYWTVELQDGRLFSELDMRRDLRFHQWGGERPFDWTLDLVDSGDIRRVKRITLYSPPYEQFRYGAISSFDVKEPGTVFQFKVAQRLFNTPPSPPKLQCSVALPPHPSLEHVEQVAQIIGVVTNKERGTCECAIWDGMRHMLYWPFVTSVYAFESWRPGIAAPGPINLHAVGLDLS
jgi:hypothetical protein